MAKDPYKYFRIEAREILERLQQGALELENGAPAKEPVARLLRLAHTLKGAARVVKEPGIADLAHAIEDRLAPHRDAATPVPRGRAGEVLALVDQIAAKLATLGAPPAPEPAPAAAPAPPARVAVRE